MPLDALAPDQRAVVQLVLQRERSYAQIAELLKISEDAVRARAHAGLAALAPDVELPADKLAQIADFLLGQQNGKPRQATRQLLRSSNGAREWAETVRGQLEDVGGSLPALPARKEGGAKAAESPAEAPAPRKAGRKAAAPAAAAASSATPEAATPEAAGPNETTSSETAPAAAAPDKPAPRPRPLRDKRRAAAADTETSAGTPSTAAGIAAGSSRLGGALLIGVALLAIVALLLALFVFKGDGDDTASGGGNATPTPTPTASATPAPVGEIRLRGVNGSRGNGVMRIYAAQGQLAFTLEGTGVPQNRQNEAYAVWFTTPGGGSQRLGFAQPVGEDGRLGTTGPRTEDLDKFPRWLARYRQVVVSRERDGNARRPGPIVLRGTLPRGGSG